MKLYQTSPAADVPKALVPHNAFRDRLSRDATCRTESPSLAEHQVNKRGMGRKKKRKQEGTAPQLSTARPMVFGIVRQVARNSRNGDSAPNVSSESRRTITRAGNHPPLLTDEDVGVGVLLNVGLAPLDPPDLLLLLLRVRPLLLPLPSMLPLVEGRCCCVEELSTFPSDECLRLYMREQGRPS